MAGLSDTAEDDALVWGVGVFDAHCHPTDIMVSIEQIASMKARAFTIMASRSQDQELVVESALRYPLRSKTELEKSASRFVIPAFGWHPWFAHQIYDDRSGILISKTEHYKRVLTPSPEDEDFINSLPAPIKLSEFIDATKARVLRFPVALIGEVGLDKAFRLPVGHFDSPEKPGTNQSQRPDGEYTPGSREGRSLSPYRVSMDHQKVILKTQLELAAKLEVPVSVHSVQAHGVVFEVLRAMWGGHEKPSNRQKKRRRRSANGAHDVQDISSDEEFGSQKTSLPFPPRVCMHSYSGPVDPLRQFLHPSVPMEIFFSFSECINFSTPSTARVIEVIKAVPESKIVIESDFHCAGGKMDDLLLDIVKKVCNIKGWNLKEGASILRSNWERFVFG